jgi:hypothetical protein
MSDTRAVRSVTACSTCSAVTAPWARGERICTGAPSSRSRSAGRSTASCSVADVTRPAGCPSVEAAASTPFKAMLSASVPPLVNTISLGSAPSTSATCVRASSSATRARRPIWCTEEALP